MKKKITVRFLRERLCISTNGYHLAVRVHSYNSQLVKLLCSHYIWTSSSVRYKSADSTLSLIIIIIGVDFHSFTDITEFHGAEATLSSCFLTNVHLTSRTGLYPFRGPSDRVTRVGNESQVRNVFEVTVLSRTGSLAACGGFSESRRRCNCTRRCPRRPRLFLLQKLLLTSSELPVEVHPQTLWE